MLTLSVFWKLSVFEVGLHIDWSRREKASAYQKAKKCLIPWDATLVQQYSSFDPSHASPLPIRVVQVLESYTGICSFTKTTKKYTFRIVN